MSRFLRAAVLFNSTSPEKMSNLWNNIAWIVAIAMTVTTMQWQRAVGKVTPKETTVSAYSFARDRQFLLLVSDWRICQQMGQGYQEVYAFETQNFYINICHLNGSFFYHRQSKINPRDTIFLPATIVFGGDYYQATDGKTVYLVGMNADGYYSSVMQNNNEIVFEPELKPSSATVQNSFNNNYSYTEEQYNTSNQVCTSDKNDIQPPLSDWQKFIGKPPEAINKYAVNNGYQFSYNNDNSARAIVNTTEGVTVIFNIEKSTQTVNDICVNAVATEL